MVKRSFHNICILIIFLFFSCLGAGLAFAADLITINNDYYAQSLDDVEDVFVYLREQDPADPAIVISKTADDLEKGREALDPSGTTSQNEKNPLFASGLEEMESVMAALNERDAGNARTAAGPAGALASSFSSKGQAAEGQADSQTSPVEKEKDRVAKTFDETSLDEEPLVAAGTASVPEKKKLFQTKFAMRQGYRHDDLRWNIAAADGTPNILSELTWSDLNTYELKGEGQVVVKDLLRLEGSYAYGWINDGDNQDSDYTGNNRTGEFSRSNNTSDGDEVIDYSFGAGLQFPIRSRPAREIFHSDELMLTLLGGYSESRQNLRMTNGYQTIPATGNFAGLNSTYRARWSGPWTGAELSGERGKWNARLRGEYHWARYYGWANWNLRDDFAHPKSYEHISDGGGVNLLLGLEYKIDPSWRLGFDCEGKMMEANAGVDRTFFADGTHSEIRFNESVWNSYSLRLGATYLFP